MPELTQLAFESTGYLFMRRTVSNAGVYKVEYSPPRGGWNKIKGFGDGEENQKLEKKEKRKFLKI